MQIDGTDVTKVENYLPYNKANLRDLIAATNLVIYTQIGFKSSIFRPLGPLNLMDDLEKQ